MDLAVRILASGFGSGYMPVASGTWGSAVAMALYWLLFPRGDIAAAAALIAIIIGVPVSTRAERIYGTRDDSRIVIDELAGYWVAVAFLPFKPWIALAGFILFRVFDVTKPFFIRRSQALPGGWGIVIDDVLAGLFANAVLRVVMSVAPW